MKKIQKAVLIGNYENAPYHPLKGIDDKIVSIFNNVMQITCTDEYSILQKDRLGEFNLCILYVDCWEQPVDEKLIKDLIDYVEAGGGLLVIHNGIAFQSSEAFAKLIGAKFIGHPQYTKLTVKAALSHEIIEDIENFGIEDEPYRFEFDLSVEKSVFMEYLHEGKKYPAGWTREVGLGRLVYLMPGHNVESFNNEVYRQIILKSGLWASNNAI
jgi:type 1 glutamine amidotransferase